MREDIYPVYGQDSGQAFSVSLAGISYCDGSYHIMRKSSRLFCIEYIVEGSGTVICDGRSFRAEKGDVYMLREGHDHDYFSDAETPWTKMWFNASGRLIDALIGVYGLDGAVVFEGVDLSEQFERAIAVCREGDAQRVNGELALILHGMLQRLAAGKGEAGRRPGEAARMRGYIDRNFSGRVDIAALSGLIYKSGSQAIRIFKREYGETPYEYLIGRRLELARELLRSTNMLIKEVAYRSGFADEHYFSSVFRRRFGLTPREYRARNV